MIVIKRALISVTDKQGLSEFGKFLQRWGVHILSTGGTARILRENRVEITDVSDYTGFPEILDGRVKTLHPRIHGGILGVRSKENHIRTMKELNIEPIDMVVVNLYAFEETVAKPECSLEDAVENIDIGGPTLIRAAAKNFRHVVVVSDPDDYPSLMNEMERFDGRISIPLSFSLAHKAFCLTHSYDGAICRYLEHQVLSEE